MMRRSQGIMRLICNQGEKVHLLRKLSTLNANLSTSNFPSEVSIVEVGPRDGLQNEKV